MFKLVVKVCHGTLSRDRIPFIGLSMLVEQLVKVIEGIGNGDLFLPIATYHTLCGKIVHHGNQ